MSSRWWYNHVFNIREGRWYRASNPTTHFCFLDAISYSLSYAIKTQYNRAHIHKLLSDGQLSSKPQTEDRNRNYSPILTLEFKYPPKILPPNLKLMEGRKPSIWRCWGGGLPPPLAPPFGRHWWGSYLNLRSQIRMGSKNQSGDPSNNFDNQECLN